MILLVDNYDSFTYNLAQYIGKFDEVQVLRNDDPYLYQVAQEADALVFSPGPGWPKDAGKMEEMIRDFAGIKPILGDLLGTSSDCGSFWRTLGIGSTGHAWQTKPDPARSSLSAIRGCRKRGPSHALPFVDD